MPISCHWRREEALSRFGPELSIHYTSCCEPGSDTICHGRHTFISHALAGGRNLAEARDAAGHGNVSITSRYLHAAAEADEVLGTLFDFSPAPSAVD